MGLNIGEIGYLNQYKMYTYASATSCYTYGTTYAEYTKCLENLAGKALHYIGLPITCAPYILAMFIGYPLCIFSGGKMR